MTQEEQIKQVAEYDGYFNDSIAYYKSIGIAFNWKELEGRINELKYDTSLDWLNPVWVKVYAESKKVIQANPLPGMRWKGWSEHFEDRYHDAINEGNISAALNAVSDAITWLKEQKKVNA